MGLQCWPTHKTLQKRQSDSYQMLSIIYIPLQWFKNRQLIQAVNIFKLACFNLFYKCENRRIPDYFKNLFLTHENTRRLERIRWAQQHFNKMETNLPNNNRAYYDIKVKHTNSKYCRFCFRHEIPKLIKDNYIPGKLLEKINSHSI